MAQLTNAFISGLPFLESKMNQMHLVSVTCPLSIRRVDDTFHCYLEEQAKKTNKEIHDALAVRSSTDVNRERKKAQILIHLGLLLVSICLYFSDLISSDMGRPELGQTDLGKPEQLCRNCQIHALSEAEGVKPHNAATVEAGVVGENGPTEHD